MAKYYVTCEECETEFRVDLVGKVKDREWKLENYTWVCDECKEKKRQEDNEKAAEEAKANGLPELQGSEKQVAWANTIRKQRIETLKKAEFPGVFGATTEKVELFAKKKTGLMIIFETLTSATAFINSRFESIYDLISDVDLDEIQDVKKEDVVEEQKQAAEAKSESTITPTEPVTSTVAEIQTTEEKIRIDFPERDDDFREIIKGCGFLWNNEKKAWIKKIGITTGSAEDRTVEIGCKLNQAGFKIRIFDEKLRNKVLEGKYSEEHRNWVTKLTTKPGYFAIQFPRDSGMYDKARKIKGSKWSRPYVLIPVEQYEAILDFADLYDFRLSAGAQKLVEQQKAIEKASIIADLDPQKIVKKKEEKSNAEIDESLIDEEI